MSVAEKCLHFSMTECSRGRRRRQKRVNIMEGEFSKLAFLNLTAVLARIIMPEKQNAIEFTITTSREYWEEKTYEEIKKATYLNPLFDPGFKAFLGEEQALLSATHF